jgi:hypothetical protein
MTILWRQRPLNRTQRLTMIFLVASLAINAMYYGFLAKIEAVALMETLIPGGPNDFAPGTPYCSTRAIAARFVLGRLSILLNDAFFVSTLLLKPNGCRILLLVRSHRCTVLLYYSRNTYG